MRALALALVAALASAGCLSAPAPGPRGPGGAPDAGAAAPGWTFVDTGGEEHSRETAAGAPAVLFFMATWCGSCRSKAAWLDDAHAEYAPRGVRFYSIGQDPTEGDADLERWKEAHAHPWPHGRDPDRAVQRAFGITHQSSFVVLDAQGHVVQRWGYPGASEQALRAAIDAALAAGEGIG